MVITSVLLLTLVLASVSTGEAQARKVLQPTELCSDNPPTAIATFEDADLEAAVRTALSVSAREDLTCGLVSGLNSRDLINVQPLLVNPGLGAGDEVDLRFTWVSCSDVAALEGKGVTILRVTSPGPPACQ